MGGKASVRKDGSVRLFEEVKGGFGSPKIDDDGAGLRWLCPVRCTDRVGLRVYE